MKPEDEAAVDILLKDRYLSGSNVLMAGVRGNFLHSINYHRIEGAYTIYAC